MTISGPHLETFDAFFTHLSGGLASHAWQQGLAAQDTCTNRLIRIPTGFGKTLGVLAAWAWHRLIQKSNGWPRRLVWCLPMRVLVEQTEEQVRSTLQHLGLLWDGGTGTHEGRVGVHLLMGGANAGQWHLYPECDAVLIGTQDMLLSRALNHGYASPRARWPMEFGLLNQDALWVMDEVQLMDVGLATSGQLQGFRGEDEAKGKEARPCCTWWMSATLQRAWLEKSPETTELVQELNQNTHRIAPEDQTGRLWAISKPLQVQNLNSEKALAQEISTLHRQQSRGEGGLTLVVLNTVERAIVLWTALGKDKELKQLGTDIRLIHSRFRPAERSPWRQAFLNRQACSGGVNRIIVATQVVEAGVDISASLLVSELAPWPSLVQRFGRCARWGGTGSVRVIDFGYNDDKQAAPYTAAALDAARQVCHQLQDVGPLHLERFEEKHQHLLPHLYPYDPQHLLLRHELDELFDTSPDLSGADVDISRFIRSGPERDVQVFWAEVGSSPPASLKPTREELCSVPFLRARDWLFKGSGKKPGDQAWVWDWLNRTWRRAKLTDIYPGQTVLVDAEAGGYYPDSGWDPKSRQAVQPVTSASSHLPPEDHADATEADESLSVVNGWQTIASHGLQVAKEVEHIAGQIAPAHANLLQLAGRWHDLGKAHAAFQGSIGGEDRPQRQDIAKAPDQAWPSDRRNLYRISGGGQRRGFRHELASTLGLFAVLQRHEPHHPALLGPWSALFKAMGKDVAQQPSSGAQATPPSLIEQEILNLSATEFDLLAYLVCAHHGKVRTAWHASPADQKAEDTRLRIRGVREGDSLPPLPLASATGSFHQLPATELDLSPAAMGLSERTGSSWSERVLHLLKSHGPFTLAWLEALLRAADQRASMADMMEDELLQEQDNHDGRHQRHQRHQLDGSRRALAPPATGRAPAPPLGGDPPPRGQLHGHGRGAGGRGLDSGTPCPADSGTTRPPESATRYVETDNGTLRYQDLVPLLAERVGHTEFLIFDRRFASLPLYDLLLKLHHCICGDLISEIAGCWRLKEVQVGKHEPPPHWEVPVLMRRYADDLEARLADLSGRPGKEKIIDDLTFAEGRLLYIHPFADFNGRVSRLFLFELLYRLNLPVVDPAVTSPNDPQHYFAALQAYDRGDRRPLATIWRRRLLEVER